MSEGQGLGASERECPGGSWSGNWVSARKGAVAVSKKMSAGTLTWKISLFEKTGS